jgi:hypothetical protein
VPTRDGMTRSGPTPLTSCYLLRNFGRREEGAGGVSVEWLIFRALLIALDRHDLHALAKDSRELGIAELLDVAPVIDQHTWHRLSRKGGGPYRLPSAYVVVTGRDADGHLRRGNTSPVGIQSPDRRKDSYDNSHMRLLPPLQPPRYRI